MTAKSCIAYCEKAGFTYAGTEYSNECCKCRIDKLLFETLLILPQIVAAPWHQDQARHLQPIVTWLAPETQPKLVVAPAG